MQLAKYLSITSDTALLAGKRVEKQLALILIRGAVTLASEVFLDHAYDHNYSTS